jgi:hypothetical protein
MSHRFTPMNIDISSPEVGAQIRGEFPGIVAGDSTPI